MPSRLLSLLIAAIATHAAAFDHVINIPPATSLAGLQSNTQVNVLDGANLAGFQVPGSLAGIEVNVLGGTIRQSVIVNGTNQLNIAGGSIGSPSTGGGVAGRSIQVTGGEMFSLEPTHSLSMEGGRIGYLLSRTATLNTDIQGGNIDNLQSRNGATTLVRGGRIGTIDALADATTKLRGGDFRLNGTPVTGTVSVGRSSILTGVLEDGSSFIFASGHLNPYNDWLDNVQLEVVPLPAAAPVVNLRTDPVPNGLREGQTLVASAGSDLGDNFHSTGAIIQLSAGSLGERAKLLDSMLIIDGGSVRKDLLIYPGSEIELRSGSIASFRSAVFDTPLPYGATSSLKMLGGTIGSDAPYADDPAIGIQMEVTIEGGVVLDELRLIESSLTQSGGHLTNLRLTDSIYDITGGLAEDVQLGGGVLSMDGGAIRRLQVVGGQAIIDGGRLGSLSGAAQLHGQFELDGVPVTGSTTVPNGSVLTGVLADGSTLAFSPMFGDALGTLQLVSAPVPPVAPTIINAPSDPIHNGVRDGQLLTLASGADAGHDFVALGAILNVAGGTVGDAAIVAGGTTLLSAGSIGKQFAAIDDAVIVVSGGVLGPATMSSPVDLANIMRGSSLSVVGGTVTSRVVVGSGSSVNAVGGVMNQINVDVGATVRVGGTAQVSSIGNKVGYFGPVAERSALRVDGGTVENVSLHSSDMEFVGGYVDRASVGRDGIATIQGGTLGTAVVTSGAALTLEDGDILEELTLSGAAAVNGGRVRDLEVVGSGVLDFNGGVATGSLQPSNGVTNFIGGRIENASTSPGGAQRNRIEDGGVVNLSGSQVRGGFFVERGVSGGVGGTFNVTGGVFGRSNTAETLSKVNLHGAEFRLNGEAVSGQVNPTGEYVLTGTLTDGSVVILSSATSDVFAAGTLELVPTTVPVVASVINSPSDPAPRGLRAGQTLNLGDGVSIGYHFAAVDATLNMTGGSIDYGMELLGSHANLQGGTVGDALFAHAGSTVNIAGGVVGDFASIQSGAAVNLTAGYLGGSSTFKAESDFVMTGGATGFLTTVHGDAVIGGGVVGQRLSMQTGSSLELLGGEFRLNGNPVSGSTTFNTGDVLTGVLSDGTPVLFGVSDSLRTFTITETAIPDASPTPIVSPASPTPLGLRNGQSLTLQSGAATGNDFTSLGATIAVDGGQIARRLEAHNSRIDLRDGTIDAEATLYGDSELVVRGGSTGANLAVRSGARLSQIGGEVGTIALSAGATLNVAGGDFGGQPADLAGQDFWSPAGSTINLFGLSFTQSGVDLLADVGLGESVAVTNKGAALDGLLADGSDFGLVVGGRGRTIGNGTFTLTKLLLGDFNHDGVVDAADYSVWRDTEGSEVAAGTGADHDFDGVITANDHEVWAANYGRTFATLASVSVPEPGAAGLAVLAAVLGRGARSRRRWRA